MDLQHFIDLVFGTVLSAVVAFGAWIVKQVQSKPSREEVRQLIADKQEAHVVQVQDIKEDIQRLEQKIDKLIDKAK